MLRSCPRQRVVWWKKQRVTSQDIWMSNRKSSSLHYIRIQVYNIDVEDLFIFSTQVMKFERFCPSSSKAVLWDPWAEHSQSRTISFVTACCYSAFL
uniref:Candidate secreted effector n=1 Tax=Meloidogyne incognita TaxID=6306 RepID=A0A914NYC1_MELIC